jgi:hypothetical protein
MSDDYSDTYVDAYSHSYADRDQAVEHEVIEPACGDCCLPEDFDIDAIADAVLEMFSLDDGWTWRWRTREDVTEDDFWAIVADNAMVSGDDGRQLDD